MDGSAAMRKTAPNAKLRRVLASKRLNLSGPVSRPLCCGGKASEGSAAIMIAPKWCPAFASKSKEPIGAPSGDSTSTQKPALCLRLPSAGRLQAICWIRTTPGPSSCRTPQLQNHITLAGALMQPVEPFILQCCCTGFSCPGLRLRSCWE